MTKQTISLTEARKLLTKTEFTSFEPVLRRKTKTLTDARLKKQISMAHKNVSKYRIKASQLHGAFTKTKTPSPEVLKLQKKADLFQNILEQLRHQLAQVEHLLANKDKKFFKVSPKQAAMVKLSNRTKKRQALSNKVEKEVSNSKHFQKTPVKRVVGFQGARSRLNQGARDHRGEEVE